VTGGVVTYTQHERAVESQQRGEALLDKARERTAADVLHSCGIAARTRPDGTTAFALGGAILTLSAGARVAVLNGLAAESEELALGSPESPAEPRKEDARAIAQRQRNDAALGAPRRKLDKTLGESEAPAFLSGYEGLGGHKTDQQRTHQMEQLKSTIPDV
jgi:hypothetical protein